MNKLIYFILLILFSCTSKGNDEPIEYIFNPIDTRPELIDRGDLSILHILQKDTTILIGVVGTVELNGEFTIDSLLTDHHEYIKLVQKYIETIKFKPSHNRKTKKAIRTKWSLPIKLRKKD